MTRQASGLAALLVFVFFFLILSETHYLSPFGTRLITVRGWGWALFVGAGFLNLLAPLVVAGRYLGLAGAGQKLHQVDREILAGRHELSREITDAQGVGHVA